MVNNVYMMIYLVCLLCIVNYCYGQEAFISFSNKLNLTYDKDTILEHWIFNFRINTIKQKSNVILKRSRDFLLYTKMETSGGLSLWLNTSCYFNLPRIFYEWKYTITWLLWNATSCDVNIVQCSKTFDLIVWEVQKHI